MNKETLINELLTRIEVINKEYNKDNVYALHALSVAMQTLNELDYFREVGEWGE